MIVCVDARQEDVEEGATDGADNRMVPIEPQVVTKQETMAIYMVRAVAVSVLVTATVLASWSVFRYTRHVEQEDFRTQVSNSGRLHRFPDCY